jgi:hypothetical protein
LATGLVVSGNSSQGAAEFLEAWHHANEHVGTGRPTADFHADRSDSARQL